MDWPEIDGLEVDDPAELDGHLCRRLDEFGITRLADTSGLDRLGVPTHSCVRPSHLDHIWVYSGKGFTPAQSRVSCVLEAIERTSALWDPARVITGPATAVDAPLTPELFSECSPGWEAGRDIAWVAGALALGGQPVHVPADLAFSGRRPPAAGPRDAARGTSNGLACSTSRDDATIRAMLEVIERDAVSYADLRASAVAASVLSTMGRLLGLDVDINDVHDDPSVARSIDVTTLPAVATQLLARFQNIGLTVSLKHIPSPTGIPTIGAGTYEWMGFDSVLATAGYASRRTPAEAAVAALLELAQSRSTDLQGSREDCLDSEKARLTEAPTSHWLLRHEDPIPLDAVPTASIEWTVAGLAASLAHAGASAVAVVDFPAPIGLNTVRVLAPGVETWHATHGHSGMGSRTRRLYGADQ